MKRNDKFYREKKLRKDIKEYDELSNKKRKPEKRFLGWKRRKKVNSAGKKLAVGQDLELLVNTIGVWQISDIKGNWRCQDEWFKPISHEQYKQLPANIQYLLECDREKEYSLLLSNDKSTAKWFIAKRYEKYLYIKVKRNIRKTRYRGWTLQYEPDEIKLRDKLWAQAAWVKVFGDNHSYWDEEYYKRKKKILEKEINRELDLE